MDYILIHSPVVGPTTWLPVAEALERTGRRVRVPSLSGLTGAPPRNWQDCVEAVRETVADVADAIVLVAHSGSGCLLPAIAERVDAQVSSLVFVDSDVPARRGATPLAPPAFLDQLRTLAHEGVLPPWWAWWERDELRRLVPDEEMLARLVLEMPSLPLSYFEASIPSPPDWEKIRCAYVLLSEGYREAAAEARDRGWPVEEIAGARHLHMVVEPAVVTGALIRLAEGHPDDPDPSAP